MNKRPEKMTEQEQLLDIQYKVAKKSRIVDIISIVIVLAILYGLAIITFVKPDNDFSEQENRYLQKFPELTWERFIGDEFVTEIGDYFADQIAFRDFFVGLKGGAEIALGKSENNDVVLCKGGYIVNRDDHPDREIIGKNLEAVNNFTATMEKLNVPTTIAIAGRPCDELTPYLPWLFPSDKCEENWDYVKGFFSDNTYINFVDLKDILQNKIVENKDLDDDASQILYRTDHHWTSFGAYYGYCEIMKAMGYTPNDISHYTPEKVSENFIGTTWRSAGMKWIEPDSVYFMRYEGDDTDYQTTIVDTNTTFNGFYDRTYLDVVDKYSAFISGNNARVDIKKVNNVDEGRKTLVLIKDSYSHTLAPFLAEHFDLIILDPRYVKSSIVEIIAESDVDEVLVNFYLGSITEQNIFGILKLGANKIER